MLHKVFRISFFHRLSISIFLSMSILIHFHSSLNIHKIHFDFDTFPLLYTHFTELQAEKREKKFFFPFFFCFISFLSFYLYGFFSWLYVTATTEKFQFLTHKKGSFNFKSTFFTCIYPLPI